MNVCLSGWTNDCFNYKCICHGSCSYPCYWLYFDPARLGDTCRRLGTGLDICGIWEEEQQYLGEQFGSEFEIVDSKFCVFVNFRLLANNMFCTELLISFVHI